MIEVYGEGKLNGYMEGNRFFNAKKKPEGIITNNVHFKLGTPLLRLKENGDILLIEYEDDGDKKAKAGFLKEGNVFYGQQPHAHLLYKFDKTQAQIVQQNGNVALELKGTPEELQKLTDVEYFGLASHYLDLFG
jgi:hypothetical protein